MLSLVGRSATSVLSATVDDPEFELVSLDSDKPELKDMSSMVSSSLELSMNSALLYWILCVPMMHDMEHWILSAEQWIGDHTTSQIKPNQAEFSKSIISISTFSHRAVPLLMQTAVKLAYYVSSSLDGDNTPIPLWYPCILIIPLGYLLSLV